MTTSRTINKICDKIYLKISDKNLFIFFFCFFGHKRQDIDIAGLQNNENLNSLSPILH